MGIKGGDKFQKALNDIAEKMTSEKVHVGFLEGAKYPDGKTVPMIAAINEYGRPDKGQPPRPFFRNMIAAKKGEWPAAMSGLLKHNKYDVVKTLKITGKKVAEQLQQSIIDLVSPPLAESTIRRKTAKGASNPTKPLEDTKHMLQSVDFEIVD